MKKITKRKVAGSVITIGMVVANATGAFAGNTVYSQSTTSIENSVTGEYQSFDSKSFTMMGDNNSIYDFKATNIANSVLGGYKDFNIQDITAVGKNNQVFSSDVFSMKDSVTGFVERYTQKSSKLFN